MKTFMLAVLALTLTACRETTAPAEKPCVPNFNNPDSSRVITVDSAGNPIIRIAWCGPITVQ